jgi:hypothetical protein
VLVACRLAGLSALETHCAGVRARAQCGPRLAWSKTAENRRDVGRADPKTPGLNSRLYWPGGGGEWRGEESRLGPSQRAGCQLLRDSSTTPRWLKSSYPQPSLSIDHGDECKRRSNNPPLKRPDFPVAPEQKSGSRYPFALASLQFHYDRVQDGVGRLHGPVYVDVD